jgi:hypothetical protein
MKFKILVNGVSTRICTFYMQKLFTAAAIAAAEKLLEKR